MVLWAETREELQFKLGTVVDMMEKLGLEISVEKTEIQCNTYADLKDRQMEITTEKGKRTFEYVDATKAIRYLGSWSTVDLDESVGLSKVKEKVKIRMERINNLRATPSTKALLIKARVQT